MQEVTQEQYEAVMGKNPSEFKGVRNFATKHMKYTKTDKIRKNMGDSVITWSTCSQQNERSKRAEQNPITSV